MIKTFKEFLTEANKNTQYKKDDVVRAIDKAKSHENDRDVRDFLTSAVNRIRHKGSEKLTLSSIQRIIDKDITSGFLTSKDKPIDIIRHAIEDWI